MTTRKEDSKTVLWLVGQTPLNPCHQWNYVTFGSNFRVNVQRWTFNIRSQILLVFSGVSHLANNEGKTRPQSSPSWLDLPHPDPRPRKPQRKTISEVPLVIFHRDSFPMYLHSLFLRFIKPCVRLLLHKFYHPTFLHLFGLHPPPKISTWTSTFRTETSFRNAIKG